MRPTEAIHFAALFLLAVLTLIFRKNLEDPAECCSPTRSWPSRSCPWSISRAGRTGCPRPSPSFSTSIRQLSSPSSSTRSSPLITATRGGARDELLIAADRAIFGVDVTVWMEQFTRPRLNDALYVFYATYYFIALIPGIILWFRDQAAARRYVFTLMLVYYVSYAGYFTIPALGPRFAQADLYTKSLTETPISRVINDTHQPASRRRSSTSSRPATR